MTPERWRQISRLYQAAAECAADERAAFLDQVCAGDPALRTELQSLLAHEESVNGVLGGSVMDSVPSLLGRTVGSYEIQSLLGAGGMGHVYRARDTRLGRDVALKILPPLFALDADRLARFRREAQVLASLNHPNIGQIYGVEETGGMYGLVLEIVDGPTLADRIAAGPLPVAEALGIARQIADALQAAHDRTIVHRDLKPANVKVRRDGTVKVLDFGLAKALAPEAAEAAAADSGASPLMTARGVVLGTVTYMAPEQARGRESDKRVDIWAFGVVLYEMLTGRSPFGGDSVADIVGAVLHREPDWNGVPGKVRPLLERCLQKEPSRRLHDIGDARPWLEDAPPERHGPRRAAWIAGGAAAVFFLTSLWLAVAHFREQLPTVHPVRFQIAPPAQTAFANYFAVSPDGRNVAFRAIDSTGRRAIWVHSLDGGESRPLVRTGDVGTSSLIWSPDSRFIGFVGGDGKLRKTEIWGALSQTICDVPGGWGGGAWSSAGIIVFGQATGGLMQVSAGGGTPSVLTIPNTARGEIGHGGPRFFPDGRHFIYGRASSVPDQSGVYVGSIDLAPDNQPSEPLLVTRFRPAYAPSAERDRGHILLVSDGVLVAYPFDSRRLRLAGGALPIAQGVGAVSSGQALISSVSASTNGVIAYRTIEDASGGPVWLDRNGREVGLVSKEALERPQNVRLSPDGERIAITLAGLLWVYYADGRPPIRLTSSGEVNSPIWTPDGRRIVFEDNEAGRLLSVPADNSASPEPAFPPGRFYPQAWSRDGALLAATLNGSDIDIVRLMPGGKEIEPVIRTTSEEGGGGLALSPDGRWLAYTSNITGQNEIWVRAYPGPGAPVRVSPDGGYAPRWAHSGNELYYIERSRLMAVAVTTAASFTFRAATPLFEHQGLPGPFDVASDGRFLMIRPVGLVPGNSPIHVVLNWTEMLNKARAP